MTQPRKSQDLHKIYFMKSNVANILLNLSLKIVHNLMKGNSQVFVIKLNPDHHHYTMANLTNVEETRVANTNSKSQRFFFNPLKMVTCIFNSKSERYLHPYIAVTTGD